MRGPSWTVLLGGMLMVALVVLPSGTWAEEVTEETAALQAQLESTLGSIKAEALHKEYMKNVPSDAVPFDKDKNRCMANGLQGQINVLFHPMSKGWFMSRVFTPFFMLINILSSALCPAPKDFDETLTKQCCFAVKSDACKNFGSNPKVCVGGHITQTVKAGLAGHGGQDPKHRSKAKIKKCMVGVKACRAGAKKYCRWKGKPVGIDGKDIPRRLIGSLKKLLPMINAVTRGHKREEDLGAAAHLKESQKTKAHLKESQKTKASVGFWRRRRRGVGFFKAIVKKAKKVVKKLGKKAGAGMVNLVLKLVPKDLRPVVRLVLKGNIGRALKTFMSIPKYKKIVNNVVTKIIPWKFLQKVVIKVISMDLVGAGKSLYRWVLKQFHKLLLIFTTAIWWKPWQYWDCTVCKAMLGPLFNPEYNWALDDAFARADPTPGAPYVIRYEKFRSYACPSIKNQHACETVRSKAQAVARKSHNPCTWQCTRKLDHKALLPYTSGSQRSKIQSAFVKRKAFAISALKKEMRKYNKGSNRHKAAMRKMVALKNSKYDLKVLWAMLAIAESVLKKKMCEFKKGSKNYKAAMRKIKTLKRGKCREGLGQCKKRRVCFYETTIGIDSCYPVHKTTFTYKSKITKSKVTAPVCRIFVLPVKHSSKDPLYDLTKPKFTKPNSPFPLEIDEGCCGSCTPKKPFYPTHHVRTTFRGLSSLSLKDKPSTLNFQCNPNSGTHKYPRNPMLRCKGGRFSRTVNTRVIKSSPGHKCQEVLPMIDTMWTQGWAFWTTLLTNENIVQRCSVREKEDATRQAKKKVKCQKTCHNKCPKLFDNKFFLSDSHKKCSKGEKKACGKCPASFTLSGVDFTGYYDLRVRSNSKAAKSKAANCGECMKKCMRRKCAGEKAIPKATRLYNAGKMCWGAAAKKGKDAVACGAKQGKCAWCGSGYCCRHGWKDKSGGCDGKMGIKGNPNHVCVGLHGTWGEMRNGGKESLTSGEMNAALHKAFMRGFHLGHNSTTPCSKK